MYTEVFPYMLIKALASLKTWRQWMPIGFGCLEASEPVPWVPGSNKDLEASESGVIGDLWCCVLEAVKALWFRGLLQMKS